MPNLSAADEKKRLRQEAFARREALDKHWRADAAQAIAERALALPELSDPNPVGGYWPIRSEVDPRPLMEALLARGQIVALSQILHPHLSWREWRPGDVLVHLAAFDRRGGRLGYGKGHFDRSIAELSAKGPVLAIGLAYAMQEIEAVPNEPHDRRLDLVVTEAGVVRPEPEGRA